MSRDLGFLGQVWPPLSGYSVSLNAMSSTTHKLQPADSNSSRTAPSLQMPLAASQASGVYPLWKVPISNSHSRKICTAGKTTPLHKSRREIVVSSCGQSKAVLHPVPGLKQKHSQNINWVFEETRVLITSGLECFSVFKKSILLFLI